MFAIRRSALAFFTGLLVLFSHTSAQAHLNAVLRGQLNPQPRNNRYADVWGEGNYAYVGAYNGSGILIIDITNLSAPVLASHYDPQPGYQFRDVVVLNGIGYFSSDDNGGIHIVDVRDGRNPVLLSRITAEMNGFSSVHEVFVADGFLYEADTRAPLVKVFDVRDPARPAFAYDIVTTDPEAIHNITAINGRLYTSGFGGKTDVYDVSNLAERPPVRIGVIDSGKGSHSSWVSNDGKILASCREVFDGDVRLFDISDLSQPRLLAAITGSSLGLAGFTAHNPYIVGNMLFVSWFQAGTVVFDISDPARPVLTGNFNTGSSTPPITWDGNWGVYPFLGFDRVLLSDLDGGLFIVDFSAAISGPRTVSSASYEISSLAPEALVTAFGSQLATDTAEATEAPLPTTLAGTSVKLLDVRGVEHHAPLFFVSPGQINYQIPADTAPGPVLVSISNSNGQVTRGSALIATAAPSLFATTQIPAPNVLTVFGTGLGADATDGGGNVNTSVTAQINGQPTMVYYAGQAPGLIGLNQFNLALPSLGPGTHRLTLTRAGRISNEVTITLH